MDQDDYMANYYRYLDIIAPQVEEPDGWLDPKADDQDDRATRCSECENFEAEQ